MSLLVISFTRYSITTVTTDFTKFASSDELVEELIGVHQLRARVGIQICKAFHGFTGLSMHTARTLMT